MYLLDTLQTTPAAFYITMGILGLIVGSFLNVVIYRLPRMLQHEWQRECRNLLEINDPVTDSAEEFNLVRPRSRCPDCGHNISAFENIPLISYLFLAGKCSACRQPISIRYPLIELLSGAFAVFLSFHFGYGLQALLAALLTWALLALSVIDFDQHLLPDDITLPFLWLGLFANMFGIFTDIYSSLIGAMAGYSLLWAVYKLFKLVTGKEGMGYGDFKLIAMLGAWLGWQMLPLIILLSSICGAVIGTGMILVRRLDRSNPIPFGPYLALAGWIALIWGAQITGEYSKWALSL
ncbi:MAG: prepilin peptidase [Gammaproteobacteria bacterium]